MDLKLDVKSAFPDCFGQWGANSLCGLCLYSKLCDTIQNIEEDVIVNDSKEVNDY